MITTSEKDFVNHWAMFGTNAVLHKLGTNENQGTVGFADCQHPGVFKTKREAAEAASKMACAIRRTTCKSWLSVKVLKQTRRR